MGNTLSDYQSAIQNFWAPQFAKSLRTATLLPSLVSRDYQGEIKARGNKVTIHQLQDGEAVIEDISTSSPSANTFDTQSLDKASITITADKRLYKAFEFDDLTSIQSLIDGNSPEVMEKMRSDMERKLTTYLRGLFAPSSSNPDHILNSQSAFTSTTLKTLRANAGAAKWNDDKPWICLLDPVYYSDPMDDSKMASNDYGAEDKPLINGKFGQKRLNFNIFEDNGMSSKTGLAFHPDALHLVMQKEPTVSIAPLTANKQFGFVIVVDMIFGTALGFNHELLCQKIQAT